MRPSDRSLEIDVTNRPTGVVVKLSGSATMERCDELNARLMAAASQQPALMVLDMADLDFICSLGLGAVVAAYLRALKYEGKVALSCPTPAIRDMLELTRLDRLLPIHKTVEAALTAGA